MVLRLGLPKGSLQEPTFTLFGKAGFDFRVASRSYQPVVDDPKLEPILLRPQEIPEYVADGILDAGLTGHDWVVDCGVDIHEVCELRYSKLTNNPIRVVLAVHEDSPYKKPEDLAGKKIATEYLRTAQRYFKEKGVEADVEFSWGADEVKVPQLVEAIVVNTETGSSLRAHNLRIIDTLLTSTTRLICNHETWANEEKRRKLEGMSVLLQGAMNAAKLVGLKLNIPKQDSDKVHDLLPALREPTVSPLSDSDWVAFEVIVTHVQARELIPELKLVGATGIVEYPLNKVVY
jgi:ATP phosphoribosyltransferase